MDRWARGLALPHILTCLPPFTGSSPRAYTPPHLCRRPPPSHVVFVVVCDRFQVFTAPPCRRYRRICTHALQPTTEITPALYSPCRRRRTHLHSSCTTTFFRHHPTPRSAFTYLTRLRAHHARAGLLLRYSCLLLRPHHYRYCYHDTYYTFRRSPAHAFLHHWTPARHHARLACDRPTPPFSALPPPRATDPILPALRRGVFCGRRRVRRVVAAIRGTGFSSGLPMPVLFAGRLPYSMPVDSYRTFIQHM